MSSALITASLLGVVLLIITGFIVSIVLERRRNVRALANRVQAIPARHQRVTVLLHPQDGLIEYGEREKPAPISSLFHLRSSWYAQRRTLVSLSFLIMVLLTLFVQSGLADGALQNINRTFGFLSSTV